MWYTQRMSTVVQSNKFLLAWIWNGYIINEQQSHEEIMPGTN